MVRPAQKSDRQVVAGLWEQLMASQAGLDDRFAMADDALQRWHNDFDPWLRSPSRRLYVSVDEATVCGFITAERWSPPPVFVERPGIYIDELFVDPAFRRRGHGRALVQAIRDWGEEVGARELRAGVVAGNEEACAFWKQIGGREVVRTFTVPLDVERPSESPSSSRIGFSL